MGATQDAHIMFPLTPEFKAAIELAAEARDMSVAGFIKATLADAMGISYDAHTNGNRKYADVDERKAAQKEATRAKQALVKDAIAFYKAKLAGQQGITTSKPATVREEQAQAELVRQGQEAARKLLAGK